MREVSIHGCQIPALPPMAYGILFFLGPSLVWNVETIISYHSSGTQPETYYTKPKAVNPLVSIYFPSVLGSTRRSTRGHGGGGSSNAASPRSANYHSRRIARFPSTPSLAQKQATHPRVPAGPPHLGGGSRCGTCYEDIACLSKVSMPRISQSKDARAATGTRRPADLL